MGRAESSAASEKKARRKPRRVRRVIFVVLTLGVAWAAWKALTWPDVAALAASDPGTTAFIERYRAERRRADESDGAAWQPVPYDRISPHLKRAVLVAEDIDFFDHDGFAVEEIKDAIETAWERREMPRGASTLTQQLAKNLWLSPSRNPLRKAEEALLTRQLESHLDKRRIFELYLNVVELGPGIYGAEAAARHYFGKSARDLNEPEAAQLAASLPRPASWNPSSTSRSYRRQVERIRGRMRRAQWLWKVI